MHADFSDVRKLLNGLRRELRDARAGWLAAAPIYYQFVSQVFRAEGLPEKWKALRPSTIRLRRKGKNKRNPTARILQDTGILRKSASGPGGPHSVFLISRKRMIIGSSLRYAKFHQEGTRNMTQRQIFTITQEVLTHMTAARLKQMLRNTRNVS